MPRRVGFAGAGLGLVGCTVLGTLSAGAAPESTATDPVPLPAITQDPAPGADDGSATERGPVPEAGTSHSTGRPGAPGPDRSTTRQPRPRSGRDVRSDFNGDGHEDLAVAGTTPDGVSGTVTVRYGGGLAEETLPSAGVGRQHGIALVSGDFNGDGYGDLAVGDPTVGPAGAGVVRLLHGGASGLLGPDGSPTATTRLHQGTAGMPGADETGDSFGAWLATGDLNADGFDDLVVGAPGEALRGASSAGAVTVVLGGHRGLDPHRAAAYGQDTPGIAGFSETEDFFGAGLAVADVTGDGRDDVIVGAFGENRQGGAIHVLPGRSGLPRATASTAVGAGMLGLSAGSALGWTLAAADVTGDGRAEVIAGAPAARFGGRDCGAVVVLSGTVRGIGRRGVRLLSQSSRNVYGVCESGDAWGHAVAAGDLTGDGRPEIVVGAPGEGFGNAAEVGGYTVLRWSATGVRSVGVSRGTAEVPGVAAASERFGTAIALHDLNEDQRADVVVSAPGSRLDGEVTGWVGLLPSTASGRPAASSSALASAVELRNLRGLGVALD